MWKALINLVNSWSYRCDHDWKLLRETRVLDREFYKKNIEIINRTDFSYICKKCMKHKKIKT